MRLELALLFFFSVFRDVWAPRGRVRRRFSALTTQVVSDAAFTTAFTLSGMKENVGVVYDHEVKACNHYFEKMGVGDYASVMNAVVEKICSNLRYWGDCDAVIHASLKLFLSGYQGCKLLLQLESVDFMLQNHTVRARPPPYA